MLKKRLVILGIILFISILSFLLIKPLGNWEFLLNLRGKKIINMILVGISIGLATITFQTITSNRILTPTIIGLDALYLLIQVALIFFFGSTFYSSIPDVWRFIFNATLLIMVANLLFSLLLPLLNRDLYRLLLVGVIFGVFCFNLNVWFGRMLEPTEYDFYQSIAYATFNSVNEKLLLPASMLIGGGVWFLWRKRFVLDVLALGREQAINLGIHYRREVFLLLLAVSLLVATSTALVGPIVFFGLLVSALTYQFFATPHHSYLLPASALIAAIILVAGQTIFERFFHFAATLSVVIEGAGGLLFVILILRKT